MTIVYYISGHGYGHGVRSCDIIAEILRQSPGAAVSVVTDLPGSFLRSRLPGEVRIRHGVFDAGMVQLDSIRVDVGATLRAVSALLSRRQELIAGEAELLRRARARVVVADIPAMPLAAARRAGIPGVAVGNFAWNWIYGEFVERDASWSPLVRAFEEDYSTAALLLRLPFCEPMSVFPRVEDLPLVASPGRRRRSELAALAGCGEDRRWVLLSFASLDLPDAALDRMEQQAGYEFFTVKPLEWRRRNIHPVDRAQMPFSDVLASVDAVVSKPGFGLVSECVVNRKPLLYADRTDFREYPILVEGVRRYLQNLHIPSASLYAGELRPCLDALWHAPRPLETAPMGGAVLAAKRILGAGEERGSGAGAPA
jgi:L-arabinokinase